MCCIVNVEVVTNKYYLFQSSIYFSSLGSFQTNIIWCVYYQEHLYLYLCMICVWQDVRFLLRVVLVLWLLYYISRQRYKTENVVTRGSKEGNKTRSTEHVSAVALNFLGPVLYCVGKNQDKTHWPMSIFPHSQICCIAVVYTLDFATRVFSSSTRQKLDQF